jgi:hypothetical protein
MTDDGFNIGVLYKGARPPYSGGPKAPTTTIEDLECAFRL